MTTATQEIEQLDVVIIGGGLSGIAAAYYLQRHHPQRSYAILESREATGGTWDLFRYPGIRSDSDLHTLGYAFKPWIHEDSIAKGDDILAYIRETATENGIDPKIRLQHRVATARFKSEDARWSLEVERGDTGESTRISCQWIFCATGYYIYEEGFTPAFEGTDRFEGPIIHPQHWPEDLDYEGKRVVVIGSGATAVTLIPAMTDKAEHVTMLQRSPSYVMPVPAQDSVANLLRRFLRDETAYRLVRRKNIFLQRAVYGLCKRYPKQARKLIRKVNEKQLPEDFDIDTHFNPRYGPWDQRLCASPDGDLFTELRRGTASIVTDTIETFTERGLLLGSGEELEADIIITATGLNMRAMGGIDIFVDGEPINLHETVAFRSMMLSGVPNFAFAVGYTNASWTLRVDLVCEHWCRLMSHMDRTGEEICVAERDDRQELELTPLMTLSAGYVQRAASQLPRQAGRAPWELSLHYADDVKLLIDGSVEGEGLSFRGKVDPAERATTRSVLGVARDRAAA